MVRPVPLVLTPASRSCVLRRLGCALLSGVLRDDVEVKRRDSSTACVDCGMDDTSVALLNLDCG